MPNECVPATEREGLTAFLDLQREALLRKLGGVPEADERRTPTASAMSLLSLLKHCTTWEQRWFQAVMDGRAMADRWPDKEDDDAEFLLTDDDTLDGWRARYEAACDISREITAARELDAPSALAKIIDCNLRWVLLHMIEETARHAGHADLIREALDGQRGL